MGNIFRVFLQPNFCLFKAFLFNLVQHKILLLHMAWGKKTNVPDMNLPLTRLHFHMYLLIYVTLKWLTSVPTKSYKHFSTKYLKSGKYHPDYIFDEMLGFRCRLTFCNGGLKLFHKNSCCYLDRYLSNVITKQYTVTNFKHALCIHRAISNNSL